MTYEEAKTLNAGDYILLYTAEELEAKFKNEYGYIDTPTTVTNGMRRYLGKVQQISCIDVIDDEKLVTVCLEDDRIGFQFDQETIKEKVYKVMPKEEEKMNMGEFAKKIMKYMTEAFERWNEPTTGDKINSILWLVHQGYCDSDRGAEMITKIIEQEDK